MRWKPIWAFCLLLPGLVIAETTPNESPRHAFDVMQIFMQNPQDAQAVFDGAFTSNMRVPPEHLGVKFYDTRTGKELDRQLIRDQMGPVRQDGAYEVIKMAMRLIPTSYNLTEERLQDLTDAAFIASMRNPPKHISIEFYDLRTGPTGQGGGISGRVPDNAYQPDSPPIDESFEAILAKFQTLGLDFEHRPGGVAMPIFAYGKTEKAVEQMQQDMIDEANKMLQLKLVELEPAVVEKQNDYIIWYRVGHFSGEDQELIETIKSNLP